MLVWKKESNFIVQLRYLLFCSVNFAQQSLHFVQTLCSLLKRNRISLGRSKQLVESFNSLLSAHEKLNSARITNEIRFVVLVGALSQFVTAQQTGKKLCCQEVHNVNVAKCFLPVSEKFSS